ncbi:DMT family transporter [Sulfitobacter sp. PS-8MA]|uniref:DMT family transporter n=1 Tax=Sulfitobacter sp. PS-8MA TaxID=3237707 RepID=UPI0034C634FB
MQDTAVKSGLAALCVIGGTAALGLTDNFVPYISERGSLWQFHFVRGIMAVALLAVLAALGFGFLRPRRFWAVAGRSLFQSGAMLIYFGCLAFLPIGVVVAGLFTSPLFVLMIAALFQGKEVGRFRWAAVAVGFLGALLVIRPDPNDLQLVAFLPLLAGVLYAIGAVATRAWCEGESTMVMTAGFFAMLAVMGGIGMLVLPGADTLGTRGFVSRTWGPLDASMWFWFAVQAVGSLLGIGLLVRGYQLGEAGHVAIFEYSLLIFASFWAWMLWGQTIAPLGLVGMGLIAGAGAVIALRSEAPSTLRAPEAVE